jgi:hypothetical protein
MVRTSFMAQSQRSQYGASDSVARGAGFFMQPACRRTVLPHLIQVKPEHQGEYVGAHAPC